MVNIKVEKIDENIILIKNVLNEKSLNAIKNFCDDQNGWEKDSDPSHESRYFKKTSLDFYTQNAHDFIYNNILHSIQKEYEIFKSWKFVQRLEPDTSKQYAFGVHHDNVQYDNNPESKDCDYITRGVVFYINDDYDGGELYYPHKDLEIKPSAGSIIIHPSSLEYAHAVKTIRSGYRYATAGFYFKR